MTSKNMENRGFKPPSFHGILKTLILLQACFINQISTACTSPGVTVISTSAFTALPQSNPNTEAYDGWVQLKMSNVETTLFNIGSTCAIVNSCSIYQSDCTNALTSMEQTYVDFSSSLPYSLTQNTNVPAGYDLTVCIKCSSTDYPAGATKTWRFVQSASTCTQPGVAVITNTIFMNLGKVNPNSATYDALTHVKMSNVQTTLFTVGSNCAAVNSCSIFQSDCTTSLTSTEQTYVSFSGSSPYTLTQNTNVAAGYDIMVCIKCSSTDYPAGATYNWQFIETMDCTTALVAKTGGSLPQTSPLVITYAASPWTMTYASGWSAIFTNADTVNCPITSCSLMNNDCTSTPTANSNFYIGNSGSNWSLTAKQNVANGWVTQTFCYKCQGTGFSKTALANYSVKQNRDCSNYMAAAGSGNPANPMKLQYDSSSTTEVVQLSSIYTVTGETDCGAVTCSLKQQSDCSTSITIPNSNIAVSSSDQSVTVKRNYQPGFGPTIVCFRCDSALATDQTSIQTFNSWSIQVVMDCTTALTVQSSLPQVNNLVITYNSNSSPITYASGWSAIFTNADATNCPITSCTLMNSDCTSTPSTNSNFYIGNSGDTWSLKAKQNDASGWSTITFCYKCVGTAQSGFSKTALIGYTVKQNRDCTNYMAAAGSGNPLNPLLLHYSASSSTYSVAISSIYTITGEADCGAVTCSFKQDGSSCTSSVSITNNVISIASSGDQSTTITRNVAAGWGPFTVCVRCESALSTHQTEIKTFNSWQIQQVMDCSTALTINSAPHANPLVIPYSSSSTPFSYISGWSGIFTNADSTNCPINSCLLMDAACSTTPSVNTNFYIGSISDNWSLKAKQNDVNGWTAQTFCYKCTGLNGLTKTALIGYSVRQSRDCNTYMSAAGSQPASTTLLQYDSSTTTQVHPISDIYTITDEADCGAVTCYLKASTGCSSSVTIANSNIVIASSNNQAITIKKNVVAGFGPTIVCVRCESALSTDQTVIKTFDAWSIQQVMDCTTALEVQGSLPQTNPLVIPYSSSGTPFTYASGWNAVFTNADTTNCPITSCTLMNADCSSTPSVNTNFYIGNIGDDWSLKAKQNEVNGWAAQTFCYKCIGTAQSGFQKTALIGYSVRQKRDCSTYMAAAGSQPATTTLLQYDSLTTTEVVPISNIYTISAPEDCGGATCYLKDSTACSSTQTISNSNIVLENCIDGVVNNNIGCWSECSGNTGTCAWCGNGKCCRSGNTPAGDCTDAEASLSVGQHRCVATQTCSNQAITIKRDIIAGFGPHVLCIKCDSFLSSSQTSISTFNAWSIQQVMDCTKALTVRATGSLPQINPLVITYSSLSPTFTYASGWSAIFDNADSTNCPITSCSLMDSTCANVLINTNFQIGANSPWPLTATQNLVNGWAATTFCYKCVGTAQSGFFKSALANYSVKQARDCNTYMAAALSNVPATTLLLQYSASYTTQVNPISDIYTIIDETDCGAVTCTLKASTACTSVATIPSSEITIASSNTITIKRDVSVGWGPIVVCVRCDSAGSYQSDIKTFNAWSIQQVRDCNTALTLKTAPQVNPLVIPYTAGIATFTYATGWTQIFDNADSVNCPISQCRLMDSTCNTEPAANSIFFIETSPWGLSAKQNDINGWAATTFCYKCVGIGFSKTALVGYSIRQSRDCSSYMTAAGTQPTHPMTLQYSSTTTTEVIQISGVYTITDAADCGAVTCTLKASSSCTSAATIPSSEITIASSNVITIKRDDAAGWGPIVVCVRCDNQLSTGQQDILTFNTWSITQVMDCSQALTAKVSGSLPQVSPLVIPYSSSSSAYVYANGYSTIFDNADLTHCPITSCVLMDNSCTNVISATSSNSNFWVDSTSPWKINGNQNIQIGWTAQTFCYKCLGTGTTYGSEFSKTAMGGYSVRQSRDCSNYITQVGQPPTTLMKLQYSASTTTDVTQISSIYTISDPTDCGGVTCYLKDSTACSSAASIPSSEITIASSGDQSITIKRNVAAGWGPIIVCIKCVSAIISDQLLINSFNAWSIQQVMNCDNALVLKSQGAGVPLSTQHIAYASSQANLVYSTGYTQIFTHSDPNNCPLTSCVLMDSTCTNSMTSSANFGFTSNTITYGITANQNVEDGWTQIDYCYKCTGTKFGGGTYSFNTGARSIRQIRNCATYIADATNQPATTKLAYSSTSTTQLFSLASLFDVRSESDCGVTSCAIYTNAVGCTTPYTTTNNQVAIDGAYQVTVKRDDAVGWGPVSLCYKCSSSAGHQTKSFNWSIQQVMNCDNAMALISQGAGVPVITKRIVYAASPANLVYATGYTQIFTHPDPSNCPVTSCALMDSTCTNPMTSSANFGLTSGTTTYGITANQNIEVGWAQIHYCYKCDGTKFEGGTYSFNTGSHYIRQVRNCATSVQNVISQPGTQTLLYSSSTTTEVINLSSIFNIYNEDDCGTTTCSLGTYSSSTCQAALSPAPTNHVISGQPTSTNLIISTGSIPQSATFFTAPASDQYISIKRNIQAGFGPYLICVHCTATPSASYGSAQSIYYTNWSIRQRMDCSISLSTKTLTTATSSSVCNSIVSPPRLSTICDYSASQLSVNSQSDFVSFIASPNNATYAYGTNTGGYESFFNTFIPDTDTCVQQTCVIREQGCINVKPVVDTFISVGSSSPWAISTQKDWVNGYKKTYCYQCHVKNAISNEDHYFNVDNLYIKQIRDCQSGIQHIPSFRNTNQPLAKVWRRTYDTTQPWHDIGIDNIINIIDDDDCGPTTCLVGQNPLTTLTQSFYTSSSQYIYMSGTVNSQVAKDFVLHLQQNREEGWPTNSDSGTALPTGLNTVYVNCYNSKQITTVTYDIQIQQVRNCATSLVLKPQIPFGYFTQTNLNLIPMNQTLPYSVNKYTISGYTGYNETFQDIESVYCPVQQCGLFQVGCVNALNTTTFYQIHMNSQSPWNISISAAVEDGVTLEFCFKCFGDTSIVHPTASFDNVYIRMIRNCATHIQNVTDQLSGVVAPIRPGSISQIQTNISSFFTFIDESDCGTVICDLYENDCSTHFTQRNVSMSMVHPDYTITAYTNVYLGYNYSTCIKCSSVSQTVTYNNFSLDVRGYGWQEQLLIADSPLQDQLLRQNDTVNTTTNATNDWKTIGDWTSFFKVKDFTNFPILSCSLLEAGCVNPYLKGNVVMGTSLPWMITALADGDADSNYNDNLCVYCTNKYESTTYDNFGVSTIDCSDTLFPSSGADSKSIQTEYDRSKVQTINGEDFFVNDNQDQCPIKTCTLFEQGCVNKLDNQNVVITNTNSILIKFSDAEGFQVSACVKCSNGQQNVTYDGWSVSQSGIDYSDIIYLKKKQNQILEYDLNGNVSTVLTSNYYTDKDPQNYPMSRVTLYEQGCQVPIKSDASKFISLDGIISIKMKQDVSNGYKLRVCMKFDFINSLASSSTTQSTGFSTITGSTTTGDNTISSEISSSKVVYQLTQDNIIFQQKAQPAETITSLQIQQQLAQKKINKTKEEEIVVDCSKFVSLKTSNLPQHSYLDYSSSLPTKEYQISRIFQSSYQTKCPVRNCQIRQQDCVSIFQNQDISYDEAKQVIVVQQNVVKGYNEFICVNCQVDTNTSVSYSGWNIIQYNKPTPDDPIVTASVTSLSATGKVNIKFSTDMDTDIDLNLLRSDYYPYQQTSTRMLANGTVQNVADNKANQNYIDINVAPNDDWDKKTGTDSSKLNWKSWRAISYIKNSLEIAIEFNDPTALSPNKKQDRLKIDMSNGVDAGIFKSKSGKVLNLKSFKQSKNIKLQMQKTEFTETFENLVQISKIIGLWLIVISLILNLFMSAALNQTIKWISSIQLVIHLPMLSVIVPSCVLNFYQAWLNIATFDILNNDYFSANEIFFTFDFESQAKIVQAQIPDQTQDLGYQSTNLMLILGSLGMMLLLYVLQLLFYFLVMIPLKNYRPQNQKILMYARQLNHQLFFGGLIVLVITGYMEFLIAAYYTLNNYLMSTNGEKLAYYMAYFVIFLSFVFLPLSLVYLLIQRRRDLHRYRIFNVIGELYAGFKTEERMHLVYYLLFAARRVIYCYVVFYWNDISWAQIMILEFMNLFMIIYNGQYKPFSRLDINRMELFNEVCIQVITIHMLCYTDFVVGREPQDIMGWSMICIIGINIVVNMSGIFKVVFHSTRLIFRRYKNVAKAYFKARLDKKFLPYIQKKEDQEDISSLGIGNLDKSGAKLTHFKIPFDPLKMLPKPAIDKLSVIKEESQDYSDRDNITKPRRYHSLVNVDYELIPKEYGEDNVRLPQMIIVLEMIKNGEIIIETLDPENDNFLNKFYSQRNEVELKNMKDLSILDTIFSSGLKNLDCENPGDKFVIMDDTDDGNTSITTPSIARNSEVGLVSQYSSSRGQKISQKSQIKSEKLSRTNKSASAVKDAIASRLLRQVNQLSYTGGNNPKFNQIKIEVGPSKKTALIKQDDKFAQILNKHVQKYGK